MNNQNNIKVMVAMSGGVDSAVTALLCLQAGYNAGGCTMKLYRPPADQTAGRVCGSDKDVDDARTVCEHLGISHTVLDFGAEFDQSVIADFIAEYQSCRTPNPCIVCNRCLKFGALLDAALQAGYDKIATGHYARIEQAENGRYLLKKAADPTKDQTYFLWQLTQHQLSHTLFPLGSMTKAEARAIAEQHGLCNAHKSDSQDICFVPDGDYAAFLHRYTGRTPQPGDFVGLDGRVLGQHRGILHYTVGQRKGLGISHSAPLFVLDKDPATCRVTLTEGEGLFRREVPLRGLNLIALDTLPTSLRCEAKLRYGHKAAPACLYPTGEGAALLVFDRPQRAPAPGQSAVFYDGDVLIGGGIIARGGVS